MVSEFISTSLIFSATLTALIISLLLGRACIPLANRFKLIDVPGRAPHKQHTQPTPMAGGLALVATLAICAGLFGLYRDPVMLGVFLAGIPIFAFGLWDDFKALPPLAKLAGQIVAAVLLIRAGISIRIFESPQFFIHGQGGFFVFLDWLITIFWVVGITNAFNFVDSMDGLAIGLGGTAAAFFSLVTLESGQPGLVQLSALILGTCIGIYFYNSPPAQLFLGDSGAQSLGFILAALAIGYIPHNAYQSSSWFAPILLLWLPIFDTTLIVFSRLRRKRPVYSPGRDHTYHRLLRLGIPPGRAVLTMQMAALVTSCLAFVSLHQPPLIANTVYIIALSLSGFALVYLDRSHLRE